MCSILCRLGLHKFLSNSWNPLGTVGNSAFPLGRSFQWELRSRCQKSKGTEFPCVPAEIKPWGSHSFTCHPHVYPQVVWTMPWLPSRTASPHFGRHSFSIPLRVEGWVGLSGWLQNEVIYPPADGHPCWLRDRNRIMWPVRKPLTTTMRAVIESRKFWTWC